MRARLMTIAAGALALSLTVSAGCGDDDGGGPGLDAAIADAGGGGGSDAASSADAAPAGGQGLGQFCNTLPDGGPACMPALSCCGDTLTCREPDDCSGAPGFLPCDEGADCPSSKLCCATSSMTFCTKQSACSAYGGTVLP